MDNVNTKEKVVPVFIGGTGRSGTTIFSKILSQNSDVYSFPQELRFITDPDGILSLKNALVYDWSKFQADLGIERFFALLRNLQYRYRGSYPNHSLSEIVGNNFYEDWINELYHQLVGHTMKSGWAARVNIFQKGLLRYFGKNNFTNMFIQESYYSPPKSEENFNQIFNQFILSYFQKASELNQSKIVIDHTPSSLIHFNQIQTMVPDAKLLHIFRDPRDIVCSYKTKDWGSTSIKENVIWICDVLNRWDVIKNQLNTNSFIEVKFESLIKNMDSELKQVCKFLNIQFNDSFLNIDVSRHNIGRWKKDLNEREVSIVNEQLSSHISNLGY